MSHVMFLLNSCSVFFKNMKLNFEAKSGTCSDKNISVSILQQLPLDGLANILGNWILTNALLIPSL